MPRRDENGKQFPGSTNRKIAKKELDVISAADKARKKSGYKDEVNRLLKNAGPAPLENTAKAITWANKVMMLLIEAHVNDEDMPLERKTKAISDLVAKVGMIRDKAKEQEDIDKLTTKMAISQGREDVSAVVAPIIRKPL